MKRELVNKLIRKFDKEKENIRDMLILSLKEIALESSDDQGKITMIIKYEEKNNGKIS